MDSAERFFKGQRLFNCNRRNIRGGGKAEEARRAAERQEASARRGVQNLSRSARLPARI